MPDSNPATSPTREKWLLILFQELGYGRLTISKSYELDGKTYPISHFWQHCPIHLVGFNIDLDKRTASVAGAARTSPHSLIQEFLNRSDAHLWAFLSNGRYLRILRDNVSLTRQAYIEFALQGMMEDEQFADFTVLWFLCHQSRVEAEKPEECWLEQWTRLVQEQGIRALENLREGVEKAIRALGSGFLEHPANSTLKDNLRSGALSTQDYYRQLLRLVYRLIFLFVAEDRNLLNAGQECPAYPDVEAISGTFQSRKQISNVEIYNLYYSTSRLRCIAERLRGSKHSDLYQCLRIVMDKLASDKISPELALYPLGSFLWSGNALQDIIACDISNQNFLEAIRALAFTVERNALMPIDYKNLGSEELGSIYESLLELHPEINADAAAFELKVASGHERKTTGSYYTPSSLIKSLLDTALEPVLNETVKKPNPEKAILKLKVCDTACGSGHFLVAAAHRIAKRLASVRTGDDEPSPDAIRKALRDVIGHCIYGVDINPMSVELCKVSLWMESLEAGKPLSFLDHHIQCGNSLIGATPALLKKGIPDSAFTPIEGDDRTLCTQLKRRNQQERRGQLTLIDGIGTPLENLGTLAEEIINLNNIADERIEGVKEKQVKYEVLLNSKKYINSRLYADAWCAAFVQKKIAKSTISGTFQSRTERDKNVPSIGDSMDKRGFPTPPPEIITNAVFQRIKENPDNVSPVTISEVKRLSKQYQFFHWHIAFPDVFYIPAQNENPDNEETGWSGGFDVVLGNPPWERIKLQEKEWFAEKRPDIANAPNATARRRMIQELATEDSALYNAFMDAIRTAEGESSLVRNSGLFPLCGRGDVNTYSIFAELKRRLISPVGRLGCIVPSGIATDDTTKFFFQDLMGKNSLSSLYDFENRKKLFPDVDSRMKFCLLTLTGKKHTERDKNVPPIVDDKDRRGFEKYTDKRGFPTPHENSPDKRDR